VRFSGGPVTQHRGTAGEGDGGVATQDDFAGF
jgi:hypothetical protein